MLGIFVQIVILAALMYVFARHEADISWSKLFLVFVPLIIGIHILGVAMGPIALLVYLVAIVVALKLWFYVDWPKATLIGVLQIVTTVLIQVIFMKLMN